MAYNTHRLQAMDSARNDCCDTAAGSDRPLQAQKGSMWCQVRASADAHERLPGARLSDPPTHTHSSKHTYSGMCLDLPRACALNRN